ncbi:MAG: hypothetical protein EKK48_24445 [Candidatus Melainabacteria bacterium]|nr:MAG: hypothetical protein EKK48_24445 [Candidatus Melainabacteria bacterium]
MYYPTKLKLPVANAQAGYGVVLFAQAVIGQRFSDPLTVAELKFAAVHGYEILMEFPFDNGQTISMVGRIIKIVIVEHRRGIEVDFAIIRPAEKQNGLTTNQVSNTVAC